MGKMIYTGGGPKKVNRKPGWKAAAEQEAEWLKSLQQPLFSNTTKWKGRVSTATTRSPVVDGRLPLERAKVGQSLGGFAHGGTKPVSRPEIMYKDNPEMLARELAARERRFATAPAYNKGNAVLVTDEMMADQTGLTRRR